MAINYSNPDRFNVKNYSDIVVDETEAGIKDKALFDYQMSNRRRQMSTSPLTDEELNNIYTSATAGNISSLLDTAQQEKEMTGTFGANWRQQSQALMTPTQRQAQRFTTTLDDTMPQGMVRDNTIPRNSSLSQI